MEHQSHPLFNVSCQNMARGSMYFGGLPLSLFASSSQRQPTGSTPVDTRKLYRTIILSAMAKLVKRKRSRSSIASPSSNMAKPCLGAQPSEAERGSANERAGPPAGSQLVEKGHWRPWPPLTRGLSAKQTGGEKTIKFVLSLNSANNIAFLSLRPALCAGHLPHQREARFPSILSVSQN